MVNIDLFRFCLIRSQMWHSFIFFFCCFFFVFLLTFRWSKQMLHLPRVQFLPDRKRECVRARALSSQKVRPNEQRTNKESSHNNTKKWMDGVHARHIHTLMILSLSLSDSLTSITATTFLFLLDLLYWLFVSRRENAFVNVNLLLFNVQRRETCDKEALQMSIIWFSTIWLRYVRTIIFIQYRFVPHLFLIGQKATLSSCLFSLASLDHCRSLIRFSHLTLIFLAFYAVISLWTHWDPTLSTMGSFSNDWITLDCFFYLSLSAIVSYFGGRLCDLVFPYTLGKKKKKERHGLYQQRRKNH